MNEPTQTPPIDPTPSPAKPKRKLRLWIPWFAIVIAAVVLGFIWTGAGDETSRQEQVMMTLPVAAGLFVVLCLWTLLTRALPMGVRIGALVMLIVLGLCVEIRGASGDVIPILAFRWTPRGNEHLSAESRIAKVAEGPASLPGAADWPQFLRTGRQPIAEGITLNADWKNHPPKELWRIPVGAAWSGIAVQDGYLLTQEQRGEKEMVTCYELATGRELWTHGDDRYYIGAFPAGEGPRATPTVHEDRVYTAGAMGVLNCLDLSTGKLLWQRDLFAEHGATKTEWGNSASPFVQGDAVIITTGNKADESKFHTIAAYDRTTGEPLWAAGDDGASYASPMVLPMRNAAGELTEQLISFNNRSITAHDLVTGAILWKQDWPVRKSAGHPKVAQPLLVAENRLFISSGYGVGCALIKISQSADGTWTATPEYDNNSMKAKFANMIQIGEMVYGLDDGILACIDPVTGKRRWKGGRYGHGQIIGIGRHILVLAEDGTVALVEANPDEPVELGSFRALQEKTWNSPTLAGRYLLVRNHLEMVCYDLAVE